MSAIDIAKSLRTPFLKNNSRWLLLEVESENISRWWLTYTSQNYRKSYFEKNLLRLLSASTKRDADVQKPLSCKLCAVPLDLFYVNGAAKHTAKSKVKRDRNQKILVTIFMEILIMVQLLLISWQYYNLLVTYQVRKIFKCSWWNLSKNSSQAVWNVKCWL